MRQAEQVLDAGQQRVVVVAHGGGRVRLWLCWHQLRDWQPSDAGYARRLLICQPAQFRAQLDAVSRAGYTTITPDLYRAHLATGAGLRTKPVLLSFDDSQGSQVSEGLRQLRRRSMTATFFVMTIVLDKPGWMSRGDLRRLDAAGMTVAAHTWDHHRADRYTAADHRVQFDQPRELLERGIRQPVPPSPTPDPVPPPPRPVASSAPVGPVLLRDGSTLPPRNDQPVT